MQKHNVWSSCLLGVMAAVAVMLVAQASHAAWQPDAWITTKAKIALASGENINPFDVNVDTVNGELTLHGIVETEAGKAAAEKAVTGIDGVTRVRNLLQVVPKSKQESVERADDSIQTELTKRLTDNPELRGSDIEVQSVNDGVVLLAGQSDSLSDHLAALRIARAVPGVRQVASEVTSDERVYDQEGQARFTDEPRSMPQAGDQPEVDRDGDSALKDAWKDTKEGAKDAWKGTKDGAREAWRATKDAGSDAAGTTSSTLSDAYITAATKTRLMADPDAPALSINVDTTNGVVTLFGTVPSEAAKQAAERNARETSGVKHVHNKLQVVKEDAEQNAKIDDDQIQTNVEKALDERELLKSADIEVDVDNGTVHLTGTVPNEPLRQSAATISRSVAGVRSVDNDLRVMSIDRRAALDGF